MKKIPRKLLPPKHDLGDQYWMHQIVLTRKDFRYRGRTEAQEKILFKIGVTNLEGESCDGLIRSVLWPENISVVTGDPSIVARQPVLWP
ncbi:hypothetical protein Avbf_11391 [Armadillidium vulgare]|nr:hypothetical protein Avbf_11391 [Armadillidium vulgare]